MKTTKLLVAMLSVLAAAAMAGCWSASQKSPDVADGIRKSLFQSGLKDVTVSQDRDNGVVTLGGQVVNDAQKAQAEALAKSMAGNQVVADQIAVIPAGDGKDAKAVNDDLDKGIERNLDAALIQNRMHATVKYAVKSAVVTLTGEVDSEQTRANAEKVASLIPNVLQVVNDLQMARNQKATSSQ